MIALNFDLPILDSAARAAQLLELLCHRGQLCLASHHPIYNCYSLPSTMLAIARDTYNAITLLCRSRLPGLLSLPDSPEKEKKEAIAC